MTTNYLIQIRTFEDAETPFEDFIIFEHSNFSIVKSTFDEILEKSSPLCEQIKNPTLPYYFDARILRDVDGLPVIVDWKESRERQIYIQYRRVLKDGRSLSKRVEVFFPIFIPHRYFPADLNSEQAHENAIKFLSYMGERNGESYKLVRIIEWDELPLPPLEDR